MNVSTLEYASTWMLAYSVPRKPRMMSVKGRTSCQRSGSASTQPAALAPSTAPAATSSCVMRMNTGACTECTASLLMTMSVLEHSP
jgi:hypothetical protein